MKKNLMDTATDILKDRIDRAYDVLNKTYKKTNPYRQEPSDPKERILHFSRLTPEDFMTMRQQFGDDVTNNYITEIAKLMRRQGNA